MSPIYAIESWSPEPGQQAPATERIALLTDGICYDLFNTVEEAEACREVLRKEDEHIEFIEDAISDLEHTLMAAPYNLSEQEARKAIRAEVNN